MNDNNQPIVKEFTQCPNCGSTARFAKDMAIREGMPNAEQFGLMQIGPHPIIDQKKHAAAMYGSKFPLIATLMDICSDCGCFYAFKLIELVGTKSLQQQQQQQRPGTGNIPPGLIDPKFLGRGGGDPFKRNG